MRTLYNKFIEGTGKLRDVPLLLFRLILAFGFYEPAMMKLKNLSGVAEWFGSMNYPLPLLSASLSMVTEVSGILLLVLGLGTRLISIPMMFIMVVATLTVHLPNGFPAGDNGFEIPLYYFLMLFALVVYGSGKFSVDHLAGKRS
ncbi:MAG: DoxX family protein [Bacteroidota bacterium]